MEQVTFKQGDIVQLKTGLGPRMLVIGAGEDEGTSNCCWFNKQDDLKDDCILDVLLKLFEPNKADPSAGKAAIGHGPGRLV